MEPGVSSSRLDLTLDLETQQAGRSGAYPSGAEMGGGSSLCEYMAAAAGLEDASVQVSPLEGAWSARRASRLGQEKPALHTKAVTSPQSFLLKTLPFRQKV